ncbi:alpha/beta hydrolase [Anaerosporobacter sp.]|uniref:alpha/beta hydrolase n=1 Tax=Anaerosporobacter sp. TaxID=1872529 RepID=UPI00286F69F3|nr:alpha/beta hydrolase family protein [Anaerosporobacter sp.]
MAFLSVEFYSDCLKRCVDFKVVLPDGEQQTPLKALYLLHGYGNRNSEWVLNSNITEVAKKYNLCVVLPSGENSFYLDGEATGRKYGTFIGEELPLFVQRILRVSSDRQDNFIGGLSMGGFGAIHTALQFPNRFGKLFAFSSALIVSEVMKMEEGGGNAVANEAYFRLMFGKEELLEHGDSNPEELVRRIKEQNAPMPEMYLACGTEDFLIQENRHFHEFLQKKEVEHVYHESKGAHDFVFWNEYLEPAVQWLMGSSEEKIDENNSI